MKYDVISVAKRPEWDLIPRAMIETYCWGGDYRPRAWARFCFRPERGFILRMECEETAPKAVHRRTNDPVCKDSCLEAFLNFKPQSPESGYLNFEANALGTQLCY